MTRFNRVVRKIKTASHLSPPERDTHSVRLRGARVRRVNCKRGRVCSDASLCPCVELTLIKNPEYQRKLDEEKVKMWLNYWDSHYG